MCQCLLKCWFSLDLRLGVGVLDAAAAAAKSLQLCPTLCDPIDASPPGSSVPGILQARTLEAHEAHEKILSITTYYKIAN